MRFNFTGILGRPKSDKRPFVREGQTARMAKYKNMSLNIAVGRNNLGFVELMGVEGVKEELRCRGTNGDQLMIAWDDRFDPDVIRSVASTSRYTVGVEGLERKEFLAPWDTIGYVQEHIEEMIGKRYTITGRVRRDVYRGAINNRFEINGIYPAKEDEKDRLIITGEAYFTSEDLDISDWKSEKKISLSAYTMEYMGKDEGRKLLMLPLVADFSKLPLENSKVKEWMSFVTEGIGVQLDETMTTAKNVLKKKNVYKNNFIITYVNGAEEVEFNESMLTPWQRRRIAAGLATLDDCRPIGNVYGERTVIMRIRDFNSRSGGGYENGAVVDEMTMTEFRDAIYQPEVEESAENVLSKGMNPPVKEEPKVKGKEDGLGKNEEDDIDIDDMFADL